MNYKIVDVLAVHGLGKRFRRYHHDRPITLHGALTHGLHLLKAKEYFWALRDVSFSVPPGCTVGIIGPNGAGKSTLLKLIGGVSRPDAGHVMTHGRIAALLNLGTGFHPELTGKENVYISSIIGGLTRREAERKFDSIVAFAELEKFIDSPIRTYSSGMQMRLAFSVAIHVEPDIFLIDEVLSVGDLTFQHKCLKRITELKARGCTLIVTSHDTGLIQSLGDQALWMQAGQLVDHGEAHEVVERYIAAMQECANLRGVISGIGNPAVTLE